MQLIVANRKSNRLYLVAVGATLLVSLVVLSIFALSLSSKWRMLQQIADTDCRFLYESEFGIDTDNTRGSEELRGTYNKLHALFFESIWMIDYSESSEPYQIVIDSAQIVGDSGHVGMFVVSSEVKMKAGVAKLQGYLGDVALAVD